MPEEGKESAAVGVGCRGSVENIKRRQLGNAFKKEGE